LKNKPYDGGGKIYLQISRSEELVKDDLNFEEGENDFRDKWGIRGKYQDYFAKSTPARNRIYTVSGGCRRKHTVNFDPRESPLDLFLLVFYTH
jgi:hypothetical protein